MKQKLMTLATAVLIACSAFANDYNKVPQSIGQEVKQTFTQATDVRWSTTNSYYKATVSMPGMQLEVFYNFNGSLIAVSRNISVDQLPLILLKDVGAMKTKYYVAELFELTTENVGIEYFITYRSGSETKVYHSTGTSGWSLYKAYENE